MDRDRVLPSRLAIMASTRSLVATILLAPVALGTGCGTGGGSQAGNDGGADSTLADAAMDGSQPKGDGAKTDTGPNTDTGMTDATSPDSAIDAGTSVLEFHLNPARTGHYIDPAMTPTYAANMKFDPTFVGTSAGPGVPIVGPLWGQPLYVDNGVGGKGTFYVADDSNDIYAIDEGTGNTIWSKAPLLTSALPGDASCGQIVPTGVTSTPIIDLASRTIYFVAAAGLTPAGIQSYQIYGLSIDDGSTIAGWPIDVSTLNSVAPSGETFTPQPEGQRTALSLVNGYLYVAFGGRSLHCGTYVGWLITVPVSDPKSATAYASPVNGSGIWAPGGISSDGVDVFAVSGNGYDTGGLAWAKAQSEAVLRFKNGSEYSTTKTTDFFAPSNWQSLDLSDTDLGGSGALIVDVVGATPSALIVQLGKSGIMHILDRKNLGGVGTGDGATGEGLWSAPVANGKTRTAAATYTDSTGTYVVFNGDGDGTNCPTGETGDLIFGQVTPTNPPTFKTLWCADSGGNMGSPIVTTTDAAGSNPIVWVVGPEVSNQLTGWDAKKGTNLFNGGDATMDKIHHWATVIDVNGRLIVGSSDKLYAFTGK
jgi:hypothetical protein